MAEHYLNTLTVSLRRYEGYPLPENLKEVLSLTIDVGEQLDIEQLADEAREAVHHQPHRIQQTYSETAWGAAGSAAQLVVDVATVVSGVGSLPTLWALISRIVLRHGQVRTVPGEIAAQSARTIVVENLNINVDDIRIVGIEPVGDGHRISLETSVESFAVEIDGKGVSRFTRS
jgi:hypothetical protein